MKRQLPSVWSLEDIADVEELVRILLVDVFGRAAWVEFEDAIANLLGEVWLLHERWDPTRTPSFRQYATFRLRQHKIPDLTRDAHGRSRYVFGPNAKHWAAGQTLEYERPRTLSLDAGERGLVEALPSGEGDSAEDWSPTLSGLLAEGDRAEAGDYAELGLEDAGRTEGRDRQDPEPPLSEREVAIPGGQRSSASRSVSEAA